MREADMNMTATQPEPDAPDAVEQLIRAARGGDSRALGELLERYRRALLAYAHNALGFELQRKQAPSDLVQDSYLAASRNFSTFEGESAVQFSGWLRGIVQKQAFQVARQYLGTDKRDIRREEELGSGAQRVAGGTPSPSSTYMHQDTEKIIQQALSALPENQSEVVRLRREAHTFEEISSLLDLNAGHVRRLFLQAMKTLKADDRLRQLLRAES
jgi:RNA polymerase sigma-70 factor (ECF subfamily)